MPDDDLALTDVQIADFAVRRYSKSGYARVVDRVAIEAPLEIRISYSFKEIRRTESAAVTMRTPGNDKELAAGFLFAEGVISHQSDIVDMRTLGTGMAGELLVELAEDVDVEDWHLRRSTLLSSACGLCGKRTIESIPSAQRVDAQQEPVSADLIYALPDLLKTQQSGFGISGGLHGAAKVSARGEVVAAYEDIGRHNALDKLIGHCLLEDGVPFSSGLLFMSSRGSFELVQKALAAGCGILATIGAPSSLAIEFSRDRGLTLIGFIREDHFNVYSGEWRIQ
jgi:FdhD protein